MGYNALANDVMKYPCNVPKSYLKHVKDEKKDCMYSITCIQRPPKGSKKSGLLQEVVFKCRFDVVGFRRALASEQWSLKTMDCLMQVVFNTGYTVIHIE